jgi:hypothetical protein
MDAFSADNVEDAQNVALLQPARKPSGSKKKNAFLMKPESAGGGLVQTIS